MLSKIFYEIILRPFTIFLMKLIWIRKVSGLDNIPRTGPVILAANHSSYLDFLIVPSIVKRRVHIVAAIELTKHPILGWYARNDGCILVDRNKPGTKYFKDSIKTLEQNQILLVFPEGTRSMNGKLQLWKRGFIRLALKTNTPIMPVAIKGTFENLPKGGKLKFGKSCDVSFGAPIKLNYSPHQKLNKDKLNCFANSIRDIVANLLS